MTMLSFLVVTASVSYSVVYGGCQIGLTLKMESANPGPRALRGGDDRKAGVADVAGPGCLNAKQSIPSLRCACIVRRSLMRGRCLSGCSLRRSRFNSWPYHLSGLSGHHDRVSVRSGFGRNGCALEHREVFVAS